MGTASSGRGAAAAVGASPPAAAAIRWIAILGIPASLSSPGATVAVALVAICGLVLLVSRRDMPADLVRVHWYMLACYLLLLAADVFNGGSTASLAPGAFNYLHLLAVAPYAYALRSAGLESPMVDRAIRVTLVIAIAATAVRTLVLGDPRPGGLNLNVVPFAFIIGIWATFLLSRALEAPGRHVADLSIVAMALAAVLVLESKIAIATTLLGLIGVAGIWALQHGRWRSLTAGLLASGAAFALILYATAWQRFVSMWAEIGKLLDGTVERGSLSLRLELTTAGWQTFLERPLLGHGFDRKLDVVMERIRESGIKWPAPGHLHNDYIVHLVAFGLAGALFLAAFLAFIWWVARAARDPAMRRAGLVLVAMVAVYMTVEPAFSMDAVSGMLSMLFGFLLVPARGGGTAPPAVSSN